MADSVYFRKKAQECRELLRVAVVPEVIEQLELWAEEFEHQAQVAQCRARPRSHHAPAPRVPDIAHAQPVPRSADVHITRTGKRVWAKNGGA